LAKIIFEHINNDHRWFQFRPPLDSLCPMCELLRKSFMKF
jgi:rubredoxin